MPTTQPTLRPSPLSESLSPSSPPHHHPYSSAFFASSSPSPPTSPSSSYTMDNSHRPQRQDDYSHSSHSSQDRIRKDPEAAYYSQHPDPYYHFDPRSGPRPHSPPPPPHYSYYHTDHHYQYHQQQYEHERHELDHQRYDEHPAHYPQEYNGYRPRTEQAYGRRGQWCLSDSAAADTLLMLSAAALMDPASVQAALATDEEERFSSRHSHSNHHPYSTHAHATFSHHQRRYSPPLPESPRLHPMAKTVSAPASSSYLPPLGTGRRYQLDHPHGMAVESRLPDPAYPPGPLASSAMDRSSHEEREPLPLESPAPGSIAHSSSARGSSGSTARHNSDTTPASGEGEKARQGQEEEEEDEVMSEGVVHLNARAPGGSSSPQAKTKSSQAHPPPSISTSTIVSSRQGSPTTPTSAKSPQTPKSTKPLRGSKSLRMPKRSQSDHQGGRGKKDSHGDYFYSPFPPSSSPSSSPSSPSSFQTQLQLLTQNFVSVQPHGSPTHRFRRVPSSIVTATATPPFSPPTSPVVDLNRDASFQSGSASVTTSPTKSTSAQSMAETQSSMPTLRSVTRSGSKPTTQLRPHFKPRWHTQPYMMFLALRAMPGQTAARQELITAAVELDKKISAEKGLPRVFTGKTPMNSASACLTNNGDKYFIPFKPEGSRSTHFRLAYQPGDFDTAVKEYNHWLDQLVHHDWPVCFGSPREGAAGARQAHCGDTVMNDNTRPDLHRAYSSPESRKRGPDDVEMGMEQELSNSKKVKAESEQDDMESGSKSSDGREDGRVPVKMQKLDIKAAISYEGSTSCPPTPITLAAAAIEQRLSLKDTPRTYSQRPEGADVNVPTCLADIVRVGASTISGAGKGLFAKVDLPAGTPLGFYFGVPMTENEFDSLKDGVGLASQYSIMYRRTVLDATDEQGQPFTDPNGALYCPFHFMNEDPDGNVSFITGSVANQVICTTNRDVKVGDELLVYYGREMDRHWNAPGQELAPAAPALAATITTSGGSASEIAEGKKTHGGSRSRASSPTKRTPAEESGRPRRETAYKAARYSR